MPKKEREDFIMKKKLVSSLMAVSMLLGTSAVLPVNAEEMPNLVVSFAWLQIPSDLEMIEEEINKITKEKIGCTVTLNGYTYGNLGDQQTLILSSPEEQWDVMLGQFRNGISGYVSKGQLTPLNSLLEEYGQDIIEVLGQEYLNAGAVDGERYLITTCRNLANQECIMFKKEIIDELGLADKVSEVDSYDDLTPIFDAIYEAHPEMYVTASSGTKPNLIIQGLDGVDKLGDTLGVLMDAQDPTVTNMFESEEYKAVCKLAKEWNDAGYIYPDITTDDSNNGQAMMANGLCASYFQTYKPGAIAENESLTKCELVAATVDHPLSVTTSVQNWGWCIPTNAKYPEEAMQFINLLFSDADLVNLLSYGVQDYHWTIDEDGFVTDGEHTDGYSDKSTWKSGNAYIAEVWKGNDADLNEQLQNFNENAEKSVALGFGFNSEDYTAEYTALTSVINQYRMLLEWGFVDDVEATLDTFNKELYDAGLQTYMDAKQEQLNAFVTQK